MHYLFSQVAGQRRPSVCVGDLHHGEEEDDRGEEGELPQPPESGPGLCPAGSHQQQPGGETGGSPGGQTGDAAGAREERGQARPPPDSAGLR